VAPGTFFQIFHTWTKYENLRPLSSSKEETLYYSRDHVPPHYCIHRWSNMPNKYLYIYLYIYNVSSPYSLPKVSSIIGIRCNVCLERQLYGCKGHISSFNSMLIQYIGVSSPLSFISASQLVFEYLGQCWNQ
jgi:hypothetical protein